MVQKFSPVRSKHIYALIFANAFIAISSVCIALVIAYNIFLDENKNRLQALAQNQAKIIESVSEYDLNMLIKYEKDLDSTKAWHNTLDQFKKAHERYGGFGHTGEFTLAAKVGNEIVFLLSHRHFDLDQPKPVPFTGTNAEPMRRALSLKSGVVIALDYRGEEVVAAYEPVKTHVGNLGVVAKIDLDEIRNPFLIEGLIILCVVVFLIIWVSILFFSYLTPLVEKQRQSIEQLETSEHLLSKSQQIAKIASWDLDLQTQYLNCSAAMYKIFGIKVHEQLNSKADLIKVIHSDDKMRINSALDEVKSKQFFNQKFKILSPKGEVHYMHAKAEVIKDSFNVATNLTGVIRDITEETIAEQNLKNQEQVLKRIFDNTSVVIVVLDEDGKIVQFNNYAQMLTGYSETEVINEKWLELFIPYIEHEKSSEVFKSLLNYEKDHIEYTNELYTKYGEARIIRWKNSIYTLEDKKYLLSVGIDITQTLILETKYKDLYESMRDGLGVIDLDNNIVEVNEAFCEMVGYEEHEILGKNLRDITPQRWFDIEMKMLEEPLNDGETQPLYEKEYIKKDGSLVPVELRVNTISDTKGNITGYWALVRDISERKTIEKELQNKEEMMIAQSRQVAMGDMVAMIAHQWRQPLTTITMVANNIMLALSFDEQIDKKQLNEDMSKVITQTTYLSNTIDDFRNFFNPSNDKKSSTLCKVFDDTLKIIGKSLENNNIEVICSRRNCREVELLDKELLQVFLVVLNNSKDAILTKGIEKGHIEVEVDSQDGFDTIKFTDNGGGISKKVISRLGEPYLTTKVHHGTGLGLYMSSIIIRKHLNGQLKWYNNKHGATVEIQIPVENKVS